MAPHGWLDVITAVCEAIGWAVQLYVTHPLLLLVAAVPAAARAYQMAIQRLAGRIGLTLEVITEAARLLLLGLILITGWQVTFGGGRSLFSDDTWELVWRSLTTYVQSAWGDLLIQAAVVVLVFGLFDLLMTRLSKLLARWLVRRYHWEFSPERPKLAIELAIKNFITIPLFFITVLRLLGVI